jgi:hypothetical protein
MVLSCLGTAFGRVQRKEACQSVPASAIRSVPSGPVVSTPRVIRFSCYAGNSTRQSSLVRNTSRGYHSASNAPAPGAPVRVTGSASPSRRSFPGRMLINLLPDFFAVLNSTDRVAAYQRYFQAHRKVLEPYWQNYVVDPDGPHFGDVVRSTSLADRTDLREMLDRTDVVTLARTTEDQCAKLLQQDVDVDIVLMVGVGAANAGELVVDGRGTAFACLEHFTSVANPDTQGLGLDPELLPLWLAHEYAHAIRYTSPGSRSEMRSLVDQAGGYYSYWDTGRQAPLRELLMNEGLAVHVSQMISPGHAAWEYFGFGRRQFARVRELEAIISRAVTDDLDRAGLGLRLRYLSGGMSDEARTGDRYVLPERSGYFLGARMVDAGIAEHGIAWAVRASAAELAHSAHDAAATA